MPNFESTSAGKKVPKRVSRKGAQIKLKPASNKAPSIRAKLAWSDFYLVLCVARHANLASASAFLALTHATLLRKLASIETRMGVRLFERERGRYTLTSAGDEIATAARAFEEPALRAELQVLGQDLRPSGAVRVAASGIVIEHLLPPLLRQFDAAFPDVEIELISGRDHVSLSKREADIAIRIADSVPDWLVGRRLGLVRFKVYQRKRGRIRAAIEPLENLLAQRKWIGFERDARELKFDRWLAKNLLPEQIRLRVDGFTHALTMLRADLGVALLPCFLEASCPELQPISKAIAELDTPIWLITHQELSSAARIKVFMQAFAPAIENVLKAGSSTIKTRFY